MSGYSAFEIQEAIDVILAGDATLLALLGNGVDSIVDNPFQEEMSKLIFPILVYSTIESSPFDTKTFEGTDASIILTAYSRTSDKEETASILFQVHFLLNHATLTVASNDFVLCRWDGLSDIVRDDSDEGVNFRGDIRFKVITQEQ